MPGNYPKTLMPHPRQRSRRGYGARLRSLTPIAVAVFALAVSLFSLPSILGVDLAVQDKLAANDSRNSLQTFPVTVDPKRKVIQEDPQVNALLTSDESPLAAAVGNAGSIFTWLASEIAALPLYQQLASVAGSAPDVYVIIRPGYREEQVVAAFGSKLHWTTAQRQAFLRSAHTNPPQLTEGQFVPGTYELSPHATPVQVQALLYDRFVEEIGSHYSTTTAQIVPVSEALTIASLLEREAAGPEDMRLISGVIWNRLFKGMNLQIDATLQYAKATTSKTGTWWPPVVPKDKYIKSAYNTYAHAGLPPGPISSVSVAAVLAALNPRETDCLFYFHDSHGQFHCSVTYKQHVALLKKYYGQGK